MLRTAFFALKREAAAGVDGVTWQDYEADLDRKIEDLSIGSIGEPIGRGPRGVGTFRSPMGVSVRWQSPPLRTKLSNGPPLRY
jgi:hypothetical protein